MKMLRILQEQQELDDLANAIIDQIIVNKMKEYERYARVHRNLPETSVQFVQRALINASERPARYVKNTLAWKRYRNGFYKRMKETIQQELRGDNMDQRLRNARRQVLGQKRQSQVAGVPRGGRF